MLDSLFLFFLAICLFEVVALSESGAWEIKGLIALLVVRNNGHI